MPRSPTTDATPPDPDPSVDAAGHRSFEGRPAFDAVLREAFERIARRRPPRLLLCDEDFGDWPLGERAVVESLERWAGPNRRLSLLGRRFDALARRHPRWVTWRRTWSHVVECRTQTELAVDPWPSFLVAPGEVAVALVDRDRIRGWWSTEPQRLVACAERFDALSQRSDEAFPATTLGL